MSITAETAKQHANDPAVLCCRAEAGITIEPANLEDPAIFDELVDSGLLNLDGCLKIGQVLGAKLTKTSDSLCPLTVDNVEGIKEVTEEVPAEEAPAEEKQVKRRDRASDLYTVDERCVSYASIRGRRRYSDRTGILDRWTLRRYECTGTG